MRGQRTIGQYRAIDLTLFALMLAVAETVIVKAATSWFPSQPYTVSVVAAITAIVMMRWGPWAGIHAVLGGLIFCFASGATPQQYVIYCAGNAFGLGGLWLVKALGHENIRGDALKTMFLGVAVLLMMQLGRALVSLLFGANTSDMIRFFTTDVISLLFTAVILWIVRHLDGMLEDQKNYLLRISLEQEEEKENS